MWAAANPACVRSCLLGEHMEFQKVGWVNPSDLSQVDYRALTHTTLITKLRHCKGLADMISWHYQISVWGHGGHFSGWGDHLERIAFCHSSDFLHFKQVQCVLLLFFSRPLCCSAKLIYLKVLHNYHTTASCMNRFRVKADLTVKAAQSCFQLLIYNFFLLSSFPTNTVQCSNLTDSQSSCFSPVEVEGSKRNASEIYSGS